MHTLTQCAKVYASKVPDAREPEQHRLVGLDDVDHLLGEAFRLAHLEDVGLLRRAQHVPHERHGPEIDAVALLAHIGDGLAHVGQHGLPLDVARDAMVGAGCLPALDLAQASSPGSTLKNSSRKSQPLPARRRAELILPRRAISDPVLNGL
jgi:hypothetical protein